MLKRQHELIQLQYLIPMKIWSRMFKKRIHFSLFLLFTQLPSNTRTDNQNGRIVRDPIKVERLIKFKVGLNATLYSLRELITNITVLTKLDDFLR